MRFLSVPGMTPAEKYLDLESQEQADRSNRKSGQLAILMGLHQRLGAHAYLHASLNNPYLIRLIAEFYEPLPGTLIPHDYTVQYAYFRSVDDNKLLKFKITSESEKISSLKRRLLYALQLADTNSATFMFGGKVLPDNQSISSFIKEYCNYFAIFDRPHAPIITFSIH